jgi:HD-GYP domain-containing protein (c-di-GMP phosphodiesterase class II)
VHSLPDADEQLQAVFRAFPDLLFVLSSDGTVLDYKAEDSTLFYLPPRDFLRRRLRDIFPPDVAIKFENAITTTLQTGELFSFDFALPIKQQLHWYEGRLVPLPQKLTAAFIRDITPRKENELTIRRQLDRLAALRTIDMAITSSLDINLTISMLINQVKTQLNVDAACLLLMDLQSQILKFAAGSGFHSDALQHTALKLGEGYAGRAVVTRQTVRTANLSNRNTDFLRSPYFAREGFTDYFAVPLIAKGRVLGVLEIFHRSPLFPNTDWLDFMHMLAGQAAIAIESTLMFNNYERTNMALTMAYDATIEGWSRALELRDRETEGHTQRVTEMTIQLAAAFGLAEQQIIHIRRGATLHDIGKMSIPDSILFKEGPLDPPEWEIMRRHTAIAVDMLRPIQYLAPALDIPQYHHEKWDGSGYPHGLKGEQIPLAARLFAVVDVYDALTSDRPYRKAWSYAKTVEYIRAEAGKHFDPKVVEFFIKMLEKQGK